MFIIDMLFAFLSSLGALSLNVLMTAVAVVAVGCFLGLAWERTCFEVAGRLYGAMSEGFTTGALIALAWSVYAIVTSATAGGAFISMLGLIAVAAFVLIVVKSIAGMIPVKIDPAYA